MLRGLLLGAVAVGAVTLGSQAAAQNFTGLYVGGNIGSAEGDVDSTDIDGWNTTGDNWDYDIEGTTGGAQVGYDWALGSMWRLGVVGEAGLSDLEGSGAFPGSVDTFTAVEMDHYFLGRGRGGIVFGGDSFLYATAGYGWVHLETEAYDRLVAPGPGLLEGSDDDYAIAVVYGIGFEQQIGSKLSIGGEWLRVDAEEVTATGEDQGAPGDLYSFDLDTEFDVLRFTVNWAL